MVDYRSRYFTGKKLKIYIWLIVFGIMIVVSCFYFLVQHKNLKKQPTAISAVFNFKELDLNSIRALRLYGKVAFWWDTLLLVPDNTSQEIITPDAYVNIPGKWNDVNLNGKAISDRGYATYGFKLVLPEGQTYALKIPHINCAYELWVDGSNLGGAGIVATSGILEKPSKRRKEFFFTPVNDSVEIFMHVSNFHLYRGGPIKTVLFGTAENIVRYKNQMLSLESFLFGLLFVLFLYHLILFHYRRKDISILIFSLLCLFILLRLLTTGEKYILEIFPHLPWGLEMRLEYLSLLLTALAIGWYFHELFPKEITIRFIRYFSYIVLPFAVLILITPPFFFSRAIMLIQFVIFSGAFWVICMNFLSVLHQREFAITAFSGFLIFILFTVNDLLHYYKIIDTHYVSPFGLLILIITQAFIVSKRSSTAFVEVESLSARLEKTNLELEERVSERTRQIEEQKEDIEQKADELSVVNKQLEKFMRFKRDVTNMMIHDLKNPLSNILGFSQLEGDISGYKEIIYSSGIEMQNLIRNILDVEKYGATKLMLAHRKENLFDIIDNAYKVNYFLVQINDIKFENTVPKDVFIDVDKEIIERVCVNLISNATKYNNFKGIIRVSTRSIEKEERKYQKIEIYNTGDKIPPEKINIIFNPFEQIHEQRGAFSYSSGIGLAYCKMAIKEHKGEIGVSQNEEIGVSFWFTIPVA